MRRVAQISPNWATCSSVSTSNSNVRTAPHDRARRRQLPKPFSVSTANAPRLSDGHPRRSISPACSIRAIACDMRLREKRLRSASSLIRSVRSGASDSDTMTS